MVCEVVCIDMRSSMVLSIKLCYLVRGVVW